MSVVGRKDVSLKVFIVVHGECVALIGFGGGGASGDGGKEDIVK